MMGRFTFEIVLALVLALFVIWARRKQEPNRPLTKGEIDRYITILTEKFPFPGGSAPANRIARMRAFAEADDGRDFYMLNLLRFNESMAEGPAPAASFAGTPQEANVIYEANTKPILVKSGAFPIFAGKVEDGNVVGGGDPAVEGWDRVLMVHYPSRRHFFDLLTNPDYLRKADFKSYAMHMELVPVKRQMVVPDFRFLAVAGALVVFLAAAWLHALLGAAA